MTTKFRVTFDIDLGKISPDELFTGSAEELEVAQAAVTRLLLASNRKSSLRDMQRARTTDQLTDAEKQQVMAECIRRAKISLQAEANLTIVALAADAVVHEDTPEREALAA